jgi:hypothetical protein
MFDGMGGVKPTSHCRCFAGGCVTTTPLMTRYRTVPCEGSSTIIAAARAAHGGHRTRLSADTLARRAAAASRASSHVTCCAGCRARPPTGGGAVATRGGSPSPAPTPPPPCVSRTRCRRPSSTRRTSRWAISLHTASCGAGVVCGGIGERLKAVRIAMYVALLSRRARW